MKKYRFTAAALSELTEATFYYEQKEEGLGSKFLDEIPFELNLTSPLPSPIISLLHERGRQASTGAVTTVAMHAGPCLCGDRYQIAGKINCQL